MTASLARGRSPARRGQWLLRTESVRTLRIIVSILVGLMVVAVVGVGLRTFYPPPSQSESELKKLDEQQKALDASRAFAGSMSRSHEALYREGHR